MSDLHKLCVAAQEWHIARNVALEQKLRVARESLAKIVRWNPRTTTATLAEQTLDQTK